MIEGPRTELRRKGDNQMKRGSDLLSRDSKAEAPSYSEGGNKGYKASLLRRAVADTVPMIAAGGNSISSVGKDDTRYLAVKEEKSEISGVVKPIQEEGVTLKPEEEEEE